MEADRRLLTRVVLRNYKSIAACDVSPAQLTFLVGPNGSNFLDALRFVADAVRFSLDHALRDRGGIGEVRRRSGGHPNHFGIRIDLGLSDSSVSYAFTLGAKPRGGYEVQHEQCRVTRYDTGEHCFYSVERGEVVRSTLSPTPAAADDRLYLVNVSGVEAFRPVYDAIVGMGFYNLNPDDPEGIRNAKGRLSARMRVGRTYRSTRHQAALTEHFDLDAARQAAPSFEKLWRDVVALLAPYTP